MHVMYVMHGRGVMWCGWSVPSKHKHTRHHLSDFSSSQSYYSTAKGMNEIISLQKAPLCLPVWHLSFTVAKILFYKNNVPPNPQIS